MSDAPPREAPAPHAASRVRWHRSLYWRVGLGLIAFLALMLAAQGALFLWTTDRIAGSMPARNPQRLAAIVASDLSAALTDDPALNLDAYVRDHYSHVFRTFLVVMETGQTVSNHDDVPPALGGALRAELERRPMFRAFAQRGSGPGPRVLRRGAPGARLIRLPVPRANIAPIVSGDTVIGLVAALPGRPPLSRVARELGPTLGLVGGGVLAVGVGIIALVVFGPVRRRLGQVQHATERLGRGDLHARAPEEGSDEVAALARSFNRMAGDLTARAEALQASDRARRQLLADVSHELNTPLTAMRGYLETLSMADLPLDATKRQRYLHIVMDETHRLERIVGDLLDLARLEGGGTAMRRTAVDVSTIFARVAERHEGELQRRQVHLRQRVPADANTVFGDPDRLEQALQNLAANALRHVPKDGEIALTADRAGDHIRIVVRDTGPGIPPEHLPLIFDRFYKADAARASGGSGLGLSIVKAIVGRHGGTISARNDGGAVFEILLPGSDPGDAAY